MRIVFTVRAASGHFHPLVPLAQAARDAGHEAVFATPAPLQATVERLDFRWLKAGLDESSPEYARFLKERSRLSGRESTRFHRRGLVSVLAPRVVTDLLRISESWRPDLVVWDYADFGGCVAAEVLGIPHVSHEAGATFDDLMSDLVAPLADLRAAYGLPPDPELRMLERYLVLSPFPPSLHGAESVVPPTRHCYRATPFDRSGDEGVPEWSLPFPDAPLVYASLSTAFNTQTALLRTFVEALREEHVNLVVTVGRNGDPGQFGPQPPNVQIEQYIPQTLLFPRCDLVISHGGSNTMLAALAHGIPQVMVPIAADQPYNAARCSAVGAALVVPSPDATVASIREAALSVLADPTHRRAAQRIRDEMESLPGPDEMARLLEELTRETADSPTTPS
jgi:UDP:flavonoid glycosyltransferase YjiC (YdhE family)